MGLGSVTIKTLESSYIVKQNTEDDFL